MRYGYVRVSTKEQCIDRQTCCFKNAGVEAKNIYADKASGKDFHRESYVKLMRRLKSEDELFVKSAEEIRIARQKGVVFGRTKIDMPDNFYAVAIKWQRGQVNLREGAEMLSVSHSTFAKWLHARRIQKADI